MSSDRAGNMICIFQVTLYFPGISAANGFFIRE